MENFIKSIPESGILSLLSLDIHIDIKECFSNLQIHK